MLPLLHVLSAIAAEPTTTVDSGGTVQVECFVAASESEVRALITDPHVAAKLTPDILAIKTLTKGECLTLGVTVTGAWDPLTYTSQRCPTATGFKYKLLQSDDITAYEAEWKLEPQTDGGTKVTYRIKTEIDLPVPQSLVRKGVIASAKETIQHLIEKLARK